MEKSMGILHLDFFLETEEVLKRDIWLSKNNGVAQDKKQSEIVYIVETWNHTLHLEPRWLIMILYYLQ